jgi:hypothetical protein
MMVTDCTIRNQANNNGMLAQCFDGDDSVVSRLRAGDRRTVVVLLQFDPDSKSQGQGSHRMRQEAGALLVRAGYV